MPQITVDIQEVSDNLYFTERIGKGTLTREDNDIDFELLRTLPTSSLIVIVNGKRWMVAAKDVVEAVLIFIEDGGANE